VPDEPFITAVIAKQFGAGHEKDPPAPVLERNQIPAERARIQGRIDRINAAYKNVKSGDRYSLTYLPGRGTELALNGTSGKISSNGSSAIGAGRIFWPPVPRWAGWWSFIPPTNC
jgi:hypothetical protein